MVTLSVQITGTAATISRLQKARIDVTNFTEEFKVVGTFLLNFFTDQVFATEGQVFNERWSPLNRAYQFRKQNKYRGRGILELTGKMRNAFRYQSDRTSLFLDNPTPYLQYHQLGTSKMPQRVIYKLAEAQRQEIVDILSAGLKARLSNG